MKFFFDKDTYSIDDIESLINNAVEESINLDFKSNGALGKSDGKRNEISKDVAAFANSDGGIIIYGINEEDHKADSLSFIDGNEYTKEWIEHIINSSIQRRIDNIEIIPIRKDNLIANSIYIVKIPRSLDTPHMSRDKRFYKRFNFESVPMEEHEIRQSYGRKVKSKLVIDSWGIRETEKDDDEYTFLCEVQIYNEGEVSEENYKINVIFDNFQPEMKISWGKEKTNLEYTVLERGVKISCNSKMPIYANETLTGTRFSLQIPKNSIAKLSDVKVKIYLLYSNGEDEMITDLSDLWSSLDSEQKIPAGAKAVQPLE